MASKVSYQSNYEGVYALKSVHDAASNTMWSLYLVCDRSAQNYYVKVQPSHSKCDCINAWIDFLCPDILRYAGSQQSFNRGQQGFAPKSITSFPSGTLSIEKTIRYNGHIFATGYTQYSSNSQYQIDITSDVYGGTNDSGGTGTDDAMKKKMNEMALTIQTLSSGLNNVISVNTQLQNKVNALQSKLNSVSSNSMQILTRINTLSNA